MTKIFISYRRSDAQDVTGRIYDRLAGVFRAENVFKDVDSIDPGEHFDSVVRKSIRDADVVVVVIGPSWTSVADSNGTRRLDNPEDLVRIEVECALEFEKRVIPVLVGHAEMPPKEELPKSIRPLVGFNAISVRPDPDFRGDMQRLVEALGGKTGRKSLLLVMGAIGLAAIGAVIGWILLGGASDDLNTPATVPVTTAETRTAAGQVLKVLYQRRPETTTDQQTPINLAILGEYQRLGDEQFFELSNDARLRSASDGYRFKMRSNAPGHLYAFQVDASGRIDWLFPKNSSSPYSYGENPIEGDQELVMPGNGGLLTLDHTTGAEQVYFVFSRSRWVSLERALASTVQGRPKLVAVREPFAPKFRGVGGMSIGGRIQQLGDPPPETTGSPEWWQYEGTRDFMWAKRSFYHVD